MKAMTKLIPIICLSVITGSFFFYSCSQEKKEETAAIALPLEAALSQTEENHIELEKVLHRYQSNPSDSLKYRFACFLIEKQFERLRTMVYSRSLTPCRYVRYIWQEKGHCNVAEAAFYTPYDTASLKGKVIGTPGCFQKDGSQMYLMGMSQLLLIILSFPVAGQGLILELLSRLGRLFIRLGAMIIIFDREMRTNCSVVRDGISGDLWGSKQSVRIH